MKAWKQRIGLALALLSASAAVAAILWSMAAPPQILTLPNGEQYRFVAAVWGTNNLQPTFAAQLVSQLPAPLANFVQRKLGNRLGLVIPIRPGFVVGSGFFLGLGLGWAIPPKPPEPSLHLWFRSISTNTFRTSASFQALLADQSGVVAGGRAQDRSTFGQGKNKWLTLSFALVPRRSKTLQLCLYQSADPDYPGVNPNYGGNREIGRVRFANPRFGRFPQWQPEPLPAVRTDGDLEVRLTDSRIGVPTRGSVIADVNGRPTRFHRPAAGEASDTIFRLDIHSPRGTNEAWQFHTAQLSDATGNHFVSEYCNKWPDTGEYFLPAILWPDERAWRLKFELKRYRGRDPEEVVTFKNVPVPPVGATNTVFLTNHVHGAPVVIKQEFWRQANATNSLTLGGFRTGIGSRITAELPAKPAGVALDFVELTANTEWKPREYGTGRSVLSGVIFLSSIPTNVTAVDITWAVQKLRTVEFLVKPPKWDQ